MKTLKIFVKMIKINIRLKMYYKMKITIYKIYKTLYLKKIYIKTKVQMNLKIILYKIIPIKT
jgi:hypothetical protein